VALTVNGVVPAGVAAVVLIVKVETSVMFGCDAAKEIGFGEKEAVAPAGSAVVTLRVAAIASLPLPRFTLTVYVALFPAATGLGD